MAERIGDVIFIENENKAVIALRGIISIVDTAEQRAATAEERDALPEQLKNLPLPLRVAPCTAIIIEGGRYINVSPENGDFIRSCLKDYAREQAAQKTLR